MEYFLKLDELNIKRTKEFYSVYSLERSIDMSSKAVFLGNKESRSCRFCRRTEKENTFNSRAHVIPHGIGNKYLFSYFECDQCNKKTSAFEISLYNYIGAVRTTCSVNGKGQLPLYKVLKSGLKAYSYNFEDLQLLVHPLYIDKSRFDKYGECEFNIRLFTVNQKINDHKIRLVLPYSRNRSN